MDAENPFVKYPPPWHAVRNAGRGTWAVIAFGRHGRDVTVLAEVPDERTARVVAAAPEMLDLLTRLRTYLRPWADGLGKLLARYDELVSSLGAETDAMPPDAPADPKAAGYVGESPTPPGRPDPDLVREVYRRGDGPTVPTPVPFDPPKPPDGFPQVVKCGDCGYPARYYGTDADGGVNYTCTYATCAATTTYAPDNPPRPDPLPPPVAPPPEVSAVEDMPF